MIMPFEKGVSNPRWNGGISEYPEHAWFKQQRLRVLKQSQGKCEVCGKPAKVVHHIDESKNNHYLKNLVALCNNCHWALHRKDDPQKSCSKTSKYKRLYGYTLLELANILGYKNERSIYYLIKTNKKYFEDKLKEYNEN
jgi:hypothetical protein